MIKKRKERQDAIRKILRGGTVRTQYDLVEALAGEGIECTQATVSRDITDMGLVKTASGSYSLPEDTHLSRMLRDMVTDVHRAKNLVVIHSTSGTAQGVAAAIDGCALPGILGSVAGDDTILVIAADDDEGAEFVNLVERIRKEG